MRETIKRVAIASGVLQKSEPAVTVEEQEAPFFGDAPRVRRYARFEAAKVVAPEDVPASDDFAPWTLSYKTKSIEPTSVTLTDITYSPQGIARVPSARRLAHLTGAIDAGFSSGDFSTSLSSLFAIPAETLDGATLIERQWPNTYGDYCSEDLKSIVLADDLIEPVIFPKSFESREYVHRDMQRLGIAYRFADRMLRIRKALVLRKLQNANYWSGPEVDEYRRRMSVDTSPPRPGSVIYLSRKNVRSFRSGGTSQLDSEGIGAIVESLGGKVVETEGMHFQDFKQLASEAETVVADHGAAMFNILLWNPKQVIELVPDDWWSPCFVVLSQHLNAEHVTLNPSSYSNEELKARLAKRLP